ncbi:MAG: hypothetical protein VX641_01420 [Planctomycetota bacterium]|nr:hypothetical protein [Planctomycetota bacterium]
MFTPFCILNLLICTLISPSHPKDLALEVSFPVEECDCVISYREASKLLDFFGDEQALGFALAITLGLDQSAIPALNGQLKQTVVVQKLLRRGVFGIRAVDDEPNGSEWVAWISASEQDSRGMIAALRPILEVNRLLVTAGVSVSECNGGLLLASEPPGRLRQRALESIRPPKQPGESLPKVDGATDPLVISFRHGDGLGVNSGETGVSRVRVRGQDGVVDLNYEGWFEPHTFEPPCCNRKLDVEIMERLPDDVVGVVVEHADARVLPGSDLIGRLLPNMVEPERSDERWTRRVVVLGHSGGGLEGAVPAVAVAIETDGPGATALRQDVSVLASLNSLRNRLGVKAGLQHLPRLSDLPEGGQRTVYARALMEPVLGGNSLSREISINWCQARGDSNWQLYATCPQLSASIHGALAEPAQSLKCVKAAHAGRLNSVGAATMVRSLIPLAGEFASEDRVGALRVGLALLFDFLWRSSEVEWIVDIPDHRTVRANVLIHPREVPGS